MGKMQQRWSYSEGERPSEQFRILNYDALLPFPCSNQETLSPGRQRLFTVAISSILSGLSGCHRAEQQHDSEPGCKVGERFQNFFYQESICLLLVQGKGCSAQTVEDVVSS